MLLIILLLIALILRTLIMDYNWGIEFNNRLFASNPMRLSNTVWAWYVAPELVCLGPVTIWTYVPGHVPPAKGLIIISFRTRRCPKNDPCTEECMSNTCRHILKCRSKEDHRGDFVIHN